MTSSGMSCIRNAAGAVLAVLAFAPVPAVAQAWKPQKTVEIVGSLPSLLVTQLQHASATRGALVNRHTSIPLVTCGVSRPRLREFRATSPGFTWGRYRR